MVKGLRLELMNAMHDRNALLKSTWRDDIEKKLANYNQKLFLAFKEQYVRYPDVRARPLVESSSEETSSEETGRSRRHR
ncbi:unnamed protein product, partial [Mesorhabditis spiculigera]